MPQLPDFKNDKEAAVWFDTHDTAVFMNSMEEITGSSGIHGVDTKCRGGSRTAPTRYADYPAKSQRPVKLLYYCLSPLYQLPAFLEFSEFLLTG